MNEEALLERIAFLEEQQRQMIANANAYNGAIQEARYWLSILIKEEKNDSPA